MPDRGDISAVVAVIFFSLLVHNFVKGKKLLSWIVAEQSLLKAAELGPVVLAAIRKETKKGFSLS